MSKRTQIEIKKLKTENFVLANQSINAKNHPEINFKYLLLFGFINLKF